MQIIINKKTLSKYPFSFSASGSVIDELAFCAGEWMEEDLINGNLDYIGEAIEPYCFNFEDDLLSNTKTITQLRDLSAILETPVIIDETSNLQAGAFIALNYPEAFTELLEKYIHAVKMQSPGGWDPIISEKYQKELEENEASFWKQQRKEWLHGDYRDYAGVVSLISKYFTESRNYGSYNESLDEYTFTIPDEEAKDHFEDQAYDDKYSVKSYSKMFIDSIVSSGISKQLKAKEESTKRKEEREKTQAYKQKRKEEEYKARIEKLKTLTI